MDDLGYLFSCDVCLVLTVASPTSCPRDTIVRVKTAKIWRGRHVQKVSCSRGFNLGITGKQGWPGSYTCQANLRKVFC